MGRQDDAPRNIRPDLGVYVGFRPIGVVVAKTFDAEPAQEFFDIGNQ